MVEKHQASPHFNTHIGHRWQGTDVDKPEQNQHKQLSPSSNNPRVLIAQCRYHGLQPSKGAVQPERNEHQEKDDRPKHRPLHHGNGLRIHDKHQPRSFQANILDGLVLHVGHIAEHRKDHKPGQEAGQAVDTARQQRVPIAVVVELVVAGQRQQGSETGSQREENLRGRVDPNLILKERFKKLNINDWSSRVSPSNSSTCATPASDSTGCPRLPRAVSPRGPAG